MCRARARHAERRARRRTGWPLRERLVTAVVLSVPVVAMAMVPALQFEYWQWLSLTLAAPVVTYAAGPSASPPSPTPGTARPPWTRAGSRSARRRRSCGQLWALFFGTLGTPGMTHPFELTIARTDGAGNTHLSGGRRRGDRLHPRRPLLRPGPMRAPAPGPAGTGRQGRHRTGPGRW
ncbi:hypothetical protein LV779_01755 [Streptomyces thinghirensis]|nr:hypothetical protein [Streptomyces thinghirensis]